MTEPTDEEKRAFWRAVANDPTAADVLREMTAAPEINVHTITWPVWRVILDPHACTPEDWAAAYPTFADSSRTDDGEYTSFRTPAGEAALARMRELAEGVMWSEITTLRNLRDNTAQWGAASEVAVKELQSRGLVDARGVVTPLGRAVLAYLEGRDGE